MNLLDALLNTNVEEALKPEEKTLKSKRLARILGQSGTVEITIRELPLRRCKQMVSEQFDKKGNFDFERNQRAQARLVAEGVVDPSLRDSTLQAHFGAETPADLAEKLFGFEVTKISDAILALSGFETGDEEEDEEINDEIKNF